MEQHKELMLEELGYDQWTVTRTGVLVRPHGNRDEDDLASGHGDCGCVSPLAEMGLI
jgi:hypothetical protein